MSCLMGTRRLPNLRLIEIFIKIADCLYGPK
jgi:hypothetical protein